MIRPALAKKIFSFITQHGLNADEFTGYDLSESDISKPWRLTIKLKEKPYFDISCPSTFDSYRVSWSKYSPKHIVTNNPHSDNRQELSQNQLFAGLKTWLNNEARPAIEDYNQVIEEYTSIVDNKEAIKEMLADYNRKYHNNITSEEFYDGLRIEREAARKILQLSFGDKLIEGLPIDLTKPLNNSKSSAPCLYSVFIKTQTKPYNLIGITKEKVNLAANAYLDGKESFTISGSKKSLKGVLTFKIYTLEMDKDRFIQTVNNRGDYTPAATGSYIKPKILREVGKDVTDDFIGDKSFGYNIEFDGDTGVDIGPSLWRDFIDQSRIIELQSLKPKDFDLAKLLKLVEELNSNFIGGNYLSVGMLGRTIMNHVPPIFGFKTFEQVAANQTRSKKKSFQHLQDSLKNIADDYLHQPIRNKETLPNATQVDFRQSMDVLLEEIVRLLK